MRVVLLSGYGAASHFVLTELPDPEPGRGQLLVDVAVAGVTFADTMLRRSDQGPARPFVPGNEIGGRVVGLGEGADPAWIGQAIVARLSTYGGYAEQAVVEEGEATPVPGGLSLEQGVALLVNGRTAVGLVQEAAISPGDRVLVEAAGGGVGTLLVQLVRRAGAGQVIAAARGEEKLDLARRLGADVAIDYGEDGWGEAVRVATGGAKMDVIFDSVGGRIGREAFALISGGGRFVIFGYASGEPFEISNQEIMRRGAAVIGYGPPRVLGRGIDLKTLTVEALQIAAAGDLEAVIGQKFSLEQAAEAHEAIEERETMGKTLLIP